MSMITSGRTITYPMPRGARLLLGAADALKFMASKLSAMAFRIYGEPPPINWTNSTVTSTSGTGGWVPISAGFWNNPDDAEYNRL